MTTLLSVLHAIATVAVAAIGTAGLLCVAVWVAWASIEYWLRTAGFTRDVWRFVRGVRRMAALRKRHMGRK